MGLSSTQRRVIRPKRSIWQMDWIELYQYRELLGILAMRDVRVRYKQTAIGVLWAVLQPLVTTGVFALLFGLLMGRDGMPTAGQTPYVLSTFGALLPWQLFAQSLGQASNSLVSNEVLITKVYFPRLIIPAASIVSCLLDFCVGFGLLIILMIIYGQPVHIEILMLPLFILMAIGCALGIGVGLAALNSLYRDVGYTIPFLLQIGLFVTPVVYDANIILQRLPGWAQVVYMLNPMAGVIQGFRWALFGTPLIQPQLIMVSALAVLVSCIVGCLYFRRMERSLADWI